MPTAPNNDQEADNPSGSQPRKRARFENNDGAPTEPANTTTTSSKTTPIAKANEHATKSFAALPTIMQHQNILSDAKTIILTHTQIAEKTKTLDKLRNLTYVPQSARFKFTLNANQHIKETNMYKMQAETIRQSIENTQQTIRAGVQAVAELELKQLRAKQSTLAAKLLCMLVDSQAISQARNATNKQLLDSLLLAATTMEPMSTFTQHLSQEELKSYYQTVLKVNDNDMDSSIENQTTEETTLALTNVTPITTGDLQVTRNRFKSLVSAPYQVWLDATTEAATSRSIATRLAELNLGTQTEALVEEIAKAPAADTEQLQQMIDTAVAKALKKPERKNSTRGATNETERGAPSPKKSPGKTPPAKQPKTTKATTADNVDNNDSKKKTKRKKRNARKPTVTEDDNASNDDSTSSSKKQKRKKKNTSSSSNNKPQPKSQRR